MIIDVEFSQEVTTIIQSSKNYHDQLKLSTNQMYDINIFAYFYEKEKHLQFFRNTENILYGFCYGAHFGSSFWMFLDENYVFYDIKLINNVMLSKRTRLELGDICPTIEKLQLQYSDFQQIQTWSDMFRNFFY